MDVKLQLGDIILLKDEDNPTYNNNTFIITYINSEKINIKNIEDLSEHLLL